VEIGESLVAAYLKHVEQIRIVVHNARMEQGEIDLVAIDPDPTAPRLILCEVSTHIDGMMYGKATDYTVQKIREKVERARAFAGGQFPGWHAEVQVWAPVVRKGLAARLVTLAAEMGPGLRLVINETYRDRIHSLLQRAREPKVRTDEPAFRMLQVLTKLKLVE
jgi:Holliday junction resolvase-like predicted endonuclease